MQQVSRQYRAWQVTLLLDSHLIHQAGAATVLAQQLRIRLLRLPKRAPELNPMDTLWGNGKVAVCADKQYTSMEEQADRFITYLQGLCNCCAYQARCPGTSGSGKPCQRTFIYLLSFPESQLEQLA